MKKVEIYGSTYFCHPIYDKYATNGFLPIVDIVKKINYFGVEIHDGYSFVKMEKEIYPLHKFVWECFNGVVPEGKVVVHIDGDKSNNVISNLELTTPNENEVGIMDRLHNIEHILLLIKNDIKILRFNNCSSVNKK